METEVVLEDIFGDAPYRKLVEAIRDFAVLHLDREGRIVSWNAGATALFGYSEAEIIGKPYAYIFTNEDQQSGVPERELKEVVETGRAEDTRWHPRRDGTRFYANSVMTALFDENGSLCGFAKVARDDTARMQMELALNASEVRYRRLFEAAYDGILILNAETGQIADVNPFLCELLDYPKAEFVGKELWEIGLFKDKDESQAAFRELQEKGYIRYEDMPLETKDGVRREVEFISNVYGEDGRQVIQCNIRDITERKAAEKSIRFQAHLLDTVEQSVIATNLDGIVIYWNQFAQKLYGWTAQEAMGRQIMELTTPEGMIEQAIEIMSHLRQGESWSGEFNVQRRDGTMFPVQIINSPVSDGEGKLIGIVGVSIDITARKRQEQALRESENKYRMLMDQASDGIHTYDMQGNFIETNSKLCEMLGYTPEELLRLNVKDLIPAEDLAVDPVRFEELRAGKTLLKERRLRRKDGSLLPVEISGRMIRDSELQAIVRDITERKRAEEELNASEERLRTIFEASRDGILVEDDERIVYVNQSYTHLFGYEAPEELIGKHVSTVISSEDTERLLKFGKSRVRGKLPASVYEFKGKRKDGTLIEVEASVSASNVTGHSYITTIVRDITARKRAEERLRVSEERFRATFEQANVGIVQLSSDGKLLMVNPGFCKIVGYTETECQHLTVKDVTHPDDYEFEEAETRRLLSGEISGYSIEKRYLHKSGSIVWGQMTASLVRRASGEPFYTLAIIEDITERKRAEEELKKINEQLEGRVSERTAALSETNDVLQEEVRERRRIEAERVELLRRVIFAQEDERRRIAREMHDQFGQGLSALTLKLAALKEESGEQVKLREQLETLEAVANQLDSDVDFLVWELRPTVLDDLGLPAALKAHVQNWSKHFDTPAELHVSGMKQIRLTGEIETVLYRITQEALNNTAKYARAGKVDIILEHRNRHVSLIIEDDGVGFDDAQAFGLNEKGLGLIGMRERAALVGGTAEIESHPNEGTTVFIRIPFPPEGEQGE